ncbi:uncharacterized protein BYT42DRAFT_27724 [Radiomyces spectabilis]|uniref:uncharacterized protein n=1 Tax=Radiomyces spectabilis TaxID=64574 RepID=UPI002221266E|nr:uncharacterized protein BYT42DRAFT_27724 [Radiomyces spectabilis]KAI8394013.1 hypothetical protein BYT42DRAFT_27724 [Radiomyces spectabilis]
MVNGRFQIVPKLSKCLVTGWLQPNDRLLRNFRVILMDTSVSHSISLCSRRSLSRCKRIASVSGCTVCFSPSSSIKNPPPESMASVKCCWPLKTESPLWKNHPSVAAVKILVSSEIDPRDVMDRHWLTRSMNGAASTKILPCFLAISFVWLEPCPITLRVQYRRLFITMRNQHIVLNVACCNHNETERGQHHSN